MKESQTYHGFTDSAVSGGGYQVSCHFVNLVNSVMSRNHVCINADQLKMTMIPKYFRGVLSQQGRFIRRGSSRRQRKTSLIGSRLRMQCAGTTCLPLKEENTPGSEVVATLVHLPALSPHRTLPQARWVVSPTPFQGICPRLSFPSCFVVMINCGHLMFLISTFFEVTYRGQSFTIINCFYFSLGLSASGVGGKMAEVGWKFTSLAGQKAAELSENVTEKVRTLHTVP